SSDDEKDAEDDSSQSGDKGIADHDVEWVFESSCMHNNGLLYDNNNKNIMSDKDKVLSEDLFNLYDIMNKRKDSGDDLKYLRGFTPSGIKLEEVNKKVKGATSNEGVNPLNSFISLESLIDLTLHGYAYTWAYKTANKMSKLDRFIVSKGLLASFPYLSALCLDKNLSDYRPILMRELNINHGPISFRFFHFWFNLYGFDKMVEDTWKSLATVDSNGMINLKKKLKALKIVVKQWTRNDKKSSYKWLRNLMFVGNENTKFFHGILNSKRSQLAICGTFVDGECIVNLLAVKSVFLKYFSTQFSSHIAHRICFSDQFTNRYWKLLVNDIAEAVKEVFALVNRLSFVISGHVQSAFVSNRQVLDGPFILNELLSWCKHKKFIAMVFKVVFEKAFGSIRTLPEEVNAAATTIGCSFLPLTLFILELRLEVRCLEENLGMTWLLKCSRLSKWKLKTLSIEETFLMEWTGRKEKWLGLVGIRFIKAIYGEDDALNSSISLSKRSPCLDIIREVWSLEATSEFSVKSVCHLIDNSILTNEEVTTRWVKVMPIKINVLTWRVRLDKLPTRLNISFKGIDISTIVCPLYHASIEYGSYSFFSCPMTPHLWRKLMRW
nr:RNA-directed DNA polymerase, eukaryota [Tanacetum cinerariifolium]